MFRITTSLGDITKFKCDAIVNAAHPSLLGKGGVDAAIHKAAGTELTAECKSLHGCEVGKAKITKGYLLPAKYVIHTPGPKWRGGNNHEMELLANCYKNSLKLAEEHQCSSIAFPSIGTGLYKFPLEVASEIALSNILDYIIDHYNPSNIEIICYDQETQAYYQNALNRQLIERLIWLAKPSNWKRPAYGSERVYIGLTVSIELNLTQWWNNGSYGDFIELSDRAIEDNIRNAGALDLNTCIATLNFIHREQHWNGGLSDVITPRFQSGGILKLAERLRDLI